MNRPEPDPDMLLVFSRGIQRFNLEYLRYIQRRFIAHDEHPTVLQVLEGELCRREALGRMEPASWDEETR